MGSKASNRFQRCAQSFAFVLCLLGAWLGVLGLGAKGLGLVYVPRALMTESPSPKALTTLADKTVLQNPQNNTLALKLKYLERYTLNSPPQTLSPTAPKPQTPKSPSKEASIITFCWFLRVPYYNIL